MTTYIHTGDVGTIFRLTVVDTAGSAIDVSGATTKLFYFQKPDGSKVEKTAVFYTDGSDGILQYTAIANDINQTGSWDVQGYIETADGHWFTRKTSFTVLATLYTE